MARTYKRASGSDADHDTLKKSAAQGALANTPFAFWSNMAEMQRRYFSNLAGKAAEEAEAALSPNAAEIPPDANVGQNWRAATDCPREIASFMSERIKKDQAFIASAVAVHDVQQLMELQAAWMQQAAQDYTSEIGKLTDVVKKGAGEAFAVTA